MLSLIVFMSDIECTRSNDRFDATLAQFEFSGPSPTGELPHPTQGVRDLTKRHFQRRVQAILFKYKVESEKQNDILEEEGQ